MFWWSCAGPVSVHNNRRQSGTSSLPIHLHNANENSINPRLDALGSFWCSKPQSFQLQPLHSCPNITFPWSLLFTGYEGGNSCNLFIFQYFVPMNDSLATGNENPSKTLMRKKREKEKKKKRKCSGENVPIQYPLRCEGGTLKASLLAVTAGTAFWQD